jgi:hypothetical protein
MSDGEVPEDLRERIWLAVSGALPPEERRALVDRMAAYPGCAEAWRVAHEMWEASQATTVGASAVAPAPATRTPLWLAAAAVLLLGTTVGLVTLLNRSPGDEFRASPGYVVASLVPPEAVLPRDSFRLRWTPGPEGSRYQVRVTTEDLRLLATANDLAAPEFPVEPALLSSVPSGASVLWQVEVSLPSGEQVTSETFIVRLR